MTIIAMPINANTVELIAVLNGGVRPSNQAFGDYYICDMKDGVTSNHTIISYDTYRTMRARDTSSFEVKTFTN